MNRSGGCRFLDGQAWNEGFLRNGKMTTRDPVLFDKRAGIEQHKVKGGEKDGYFIRKEQVTREDYEQKAVEIGERSDRLYNQKRPPERTGSASAQGAATEEGQAPEGLALKLGAKGNPGVVRHTKGDSPSYYAVVEATDLIPSHDPLKGFAKDSRYPEGGQERQYQAAPHEQARISRLLPAMSPPSLHMPGIIQGFSPEGNRFPLENL